MKPKRIVLVTAAIAAALVAAAAVPASAHGGDRDSDGSPEQEVVVTTTDVTWTLTPDRCSEITAPTTIIGTTVLVDLITTTTRPNGLKTISFESHAVGLATDQAGHRYQFAYDNTSTQTNSRAHPDVYVGRMVDEFRLEGTGPVHLHNGFRAVITDDQGAGTFTIDGKSAFGDPYDFDAGTNRCDPI